LCRTQPFVTSAAATLALSADDLAALDSAAAPAA